jgi:hypothetical protein
MVAGHEIGVGEVAGIGVLEDARVSQSAPPAAPSWSHCSKVSAPSCSSRRKPEPNGLELPSQPESRLSSAPSSPESRNMSPPAPAVKSVTVIAAVPWSAWAISIVSLPVPVVIVLAL